MNLLRNPVTKADTSCKVDQNDRFQSIIDFPNFLLIVLKVTMMKTSAFDYKAFKLDDKELLIEFKNTLDSMLPEQKPNFVRDFAFNLLKARYLLDNYVIHHTLSDKELSGDNPWKLQYYKFENRKGYPVNLSTDDKVQEEMVHLLSMFEVAFTPKQRKNYLVYTMMYLFDDYMASKDKYLGFLQRLADMYFYHVYLNAERLSERNLPKPNSFDEALLENGALNNKGIDCGRIDYKAVFESIYQPGRADIPLFVFNYTDYMIWKSMLIHCVVAIPKRVLRKEMSSLSCLVVPISNWILSVVSISRVLVSHWNIIILRLKLVPTILSVKKRLIALAILR